MHQKDTIFRTVPAGKIIVYGTKEAYKLAHNGREPADDGVPQEKVTLSTGSVVQGYRAARLQESGQAADDCKRPFLMV